MVPLDSTVLETIRVMSSVSAASERALGGCQMVGTFSSVHIHQTREYSSYDHEMGEY